MLYLGGMKSSNYSALSGDGWSPEEDLGLGLIRGNLSSTSPAREDPALEYCMMRTLLHFHTVTTGCRES